MLIHTASSLNELETIAASIGRNEGRDFSFIAKLTYAGRERIVQATAQHTRVQRGAIADVIPASRYAAKGGVA